MRRVYSLRFRCVKLCGLRLKFFKVWAVSDVRFGFFRRWCLACLGFMVSILSGLTGLDSEAGIPLGLNSLRCSNVKTLVSDGLGG